MVPDPVWPAAALAAFQFADAAFSRRPLWFVEECLDGVRFPRRYWSIFTPIKAAAGAGLLLGLWIPYVGTITAAALVSYFVLAVGSHVRVADMGRYLLSATAMLAASTVVLATFV
jgi:hypothetical protein